MAHFILVAVPESARRRVQLTCDSFAALADVCNLLQQCKAHGAGRLAPELRAKTEEHFVLFNKAYGVAWCKPKRHLTLHIPDQVEQDNTLYDCFPLERKKQEVEACWQARLLQRGYLSSEHVISRYASALPRPSATSRGSSDRRHSRHWACRVCPFRPN